MRFKIPKSLLAAACAAAPLLLAPLAPAWANITFSTGNTQYYNVNVQAASNVATAIGDIGNTGDQMSFNTMMGPYPSLNGTQINMHCQNGVAYCESYYDSTVSTNNHTGFSSITLTALNNTAWTAGDFKLDFLGSNGTVTFTAYDSLNNLLGGANPQSFSFSVNGQNPYQFVTTNNELVTSLTFTTTSPNNMADIKQVSLQPFGAPPVPEPSSLILLGTALVGLGFFYNGRRRISK